MFDEAFVEFKSWLWFDSTRLWWKYCSVFIWRGWFESYQGQILQ